MMMDERDLSALDKRNEISALDVFGAEDWMTSFGDEGEVTLNYFRWFPVLLSRD